jgi:hypothetical protein
MKEGVILLELLAHVRVRIASDLLSVDVSSDRVVRRHGRIMMRDVLIAKVMGRGSACSQCGACKDKSDCGSSDEGPHVSVSVMIVIIDTEKIGTALKSAVTRVWEKLRISHKVRFVCLAGMGE